MRIREFLMGFGAAVGILGLGMGIWDWEREFWDWEQGFGTGNGRIPGIPFPAAPSTRRSGGERIQREENLGIWAIPDSPCGIFSLFFLPPFPPPSLPSHSQISLWVLSPEFPVFPLPPLPGIPGILPFPASGILSPSSPMAFALSTFMAHAGIRPREPRECRESRECRGPEKLPDKDKWLPFFPKAKKVGMARNSGNSRQESGLGGIPGVSTQILGI